MITGAVLSKQLATTRRICRANAAPTGPQESGKAACSQGVRTLCPLAAYSEDRFYVPSVSGVPDTNLPTLRHGWFLAKMAQTFDPERL